MLVSADAGADLRAQVAARSRPCPDFLRLEERHGVHLLDWNGVGRRSHHRSVGRSVRHVLAALGQMEGVSAVLSDGEHVGIPMAVALRARRLTTPHLVIGHRLSSPRKAPLFRWAQVGRRMDRIIVHSPNQLPLLERQLGLSSPQVHVVPYGIDTEFWSPGSDEEEEDLVVSAGREHRDYQTLVEAVAGRGRLFITDASAHSPRAHRRQPSVWPDSVERRAVGVLELRRLYGRATVVVVPLLPTSYPFGITTVLEAMAMGKAVVVSDTEGLRGTVEDGRNALVVPPGDAAALRDAVDRLRDDPGARAQLGRAARQDVVRLFGLDRFVDELARHLHELSDGSVVTNKDE